MYALEWQWENNSDKWYRFGYTFETLDSTWQKAVPWYGYRKKGVPWFSYGPNIFRVLELNENGNVIQIYESDNSE